MNVEMKCLHCSYRFAASPDCPADEIQRRMTDEGPWVALGPGETFEDMICSALLSRGSIRCPECRHPVLVGEESLIGGAMVKV